MYTVNKIFRQVLFDSNFTLYCEVLGLILISILVVFQIYAFTVLLQESFRRKKLLSPSAPVSSGSVRKENGESEFQRSWQKIAPCFFSGNGFPRPRCEINLARLFSDIQFLESLPLTCAEEQEKLDHLKKTAEIYLKRKFVQIDRKWMIGIHLLIAICALIILCFPKLPSIGPLILYIVIAEGIAWIGTGYFKLLLIILAVPESLNEDILDPRLYRLGRALLRFPKWLLNLTDSMLRKLFRWLGKEMKESEKSILVLNYERRVLRVEDDDTRQFAALICTGFSLLLICGLFVHFLFLWVELLIILCFYLLPFVFAFYFFRNYVFYGHFQKKLAIAICLIGMSCALTGGIFFYTAWQEKSTDAAAAEAEKEKEKARRRSSGQEISAQEKQAVEERTGKLIHLLDAFPRQIRVRLLSFHKNFRRNAGIVTVKYQLEIIPDDLAGYGENFRKELAGLGFSSRPTGGRNFIQIIYSVSGIEPAKSYIAAQNLSAQTLARYYDKRTLLCRFDFLDRNGDVSLSRTISVGTPIQFNGSVIHLSHPQSNPLSRTARFRFRFQRNSTPPEMERVLLTLIYADSGAETMEEHAEVSRNR